MITTRNSETAFCCNQVNEEVQGNHHPRRSTSLEWSVKIPQTVVRGWDYCTFWWGVKVLVESPSRPLLALLWAFYTGGLLFFLRWGITLREKKKSHKRCKEKKKSKAQMIYTWCWCQKKKKLRMWTTIWNMHLVYRVFFKIKISNLDKTLHPFSFSNLPLVKFSMSIVTVRAKAVPDTRTFIRRCGL